MEQSITLELSLAETNAVLTALGQLPFVQVADLIAKVRDQAIRQTQQVQEAPQEAE